MNRTYGSTEIEKLTGFYHMAHWKGKDYRNFLFHYGIPILQVHSKNENAKKMLLYLSEAFYLLSIKSINDNIIARSGANINKFLLLFKNEFGEESVTINFHELIHVCEQIEKSGPLWLQSTFAYEGLNLKLRQFGILVIHNLFNYNRFLCLKYCDLDLNSDNLQFRKLK